MSQSARTGTVERKTRETDVRLELSLDGPLSGEDNSIRVPDGFFGHMLEALATHGGMGVALEASGDTHVDLHHTVEDVGLAFGEALRQALGDRAGVVRFATAHAPLDEALARAVVDLSGRGFLVFEQAPELEGRWVTQDFPLTLLVDFFQAFADRGRFTLHLDLLRGRNPHHAAEAAFKAVAVALRQAVSIRAGAGGSGPGVPSTKGTLTA